jgi:hypothetical protein
MNGINAEVEFFSQKVFIISFGQIGLMFLLCFFCLFTGRYKTELLLAYFSILYWGFVSNRGHYCSCLEIMIQDSCYICLVQPPSQ